MKVKRCIIVVAYNPGGVRNSVEIQPDDFIICADGGYDIAVADNLYPDLLIGDFDSISEHTPRAKKIIRVPSEKDDTDLMICIQHALDKGFDEYIIIGGIGGRLDHTLGNIQSMSYACDHIRKIVMCDPENTLTMLSGGDVTLQKQPGKKHFSLFSITEECTDVTITGAKYPLTGARLAYNVTLGVSNEFVSNEVTVSLGSGKLLVVS